MVNQLSLMAMWYVYFLESKNSDFVYTGMTNNIKARLLEHNSGNVFSTKPYAPFLIAGYIALPTKQRAAALEQYFKTGSGKAVLKKRILQSTKL